MPPRPAPTDCDTVLRNLWAFLDRTLDAEVMASIDAHLAVCGECHAHTTFERRVIEQIRALRTEHADLAGSRKRLLALLRRAREAADER